jgi:ribonuclease HII
MLSVTFQSNVLEAGCDEAGRGCLAGPVFASAVILPSDYRNTELNDSKQISEKKRNKLRLEIEAEALAYAVAKVDVDIIDRINILQASILAMHRALDLLKKTPEYIVVDGNRFKSWNNVPYNCIVKGDGKYLNIAAASVLAKTYRDDYMRELHLQFPLYGWDCNMAYATKEHREAIIKHGITPHHRRSFQLSYDSIQLELFK